MFSNNCHNQETESMIWKIKDEQNNWFADVEGISQLIIREFSKRPKLDATIIPSHEILLSEEIIEAYNENLTLEVLDEEVLEVLKQINRVKALGPKSMQDIFFYRSWTHNR